MNSIRSIANSKKFWVSTLQFWFSLFIALYFYAKTDILIWQRIFESHELWSLGIGAYHWGWMQSLLGLMILGALLYFPNLRRMVCFPLYLGILAFSGAEDILYYWLDGRSLPLVLPWLNHSPFLLQPVTDWRLVLSALLWLFFLFLLEISGLFLELNWRILVRGRIPPLGSRATAFVPRVIIKIARRLGRRPQTLPVE